MQSPRALVPSTRLSPDRPTSPRLARAALGLALFLLLGFIPTHAPAPFAEQIDRILDGHVGQSALWGVYVQDVESGQVLYAFNPTKAFTPASNQKLLTTATALDALGADYRYETTLLFDGDVRDGVMHGDLIVKGSGDPTFGSRAVRATDPLRAWAAELSDRGIHRIEGRIIGDDDVFDDDPYAEGWDVSFITREAFAPASGGLAYSDNTVRIQIQADRPGQPPLTRSQPFEYLKIQNSAATSSRRQGRYPSVHRPFGRDEVVLRGSVPATYRGTVELPVADPTAFTLGGFRHVLEAQGIDVAATLVDVDDLDAPLRPDRAEVLAVHFSPPLRDIIAQINKESNNLYAEHLFRTFGWGGSTEGGARRVHRLLARAGVSGDGVSVSDGSGLSRKNMLTPRALGEVLTYMYTHPEQDAFTSSLAQGGEVRTTLRYRLRGAPIRAKTGSLKHVRTLSGYVTTPAGRPLAFVIFANNYSVSSYRIMRAIDEIVLTMTTNPVG